MSCGRAGQIDVEAFLIDSGSAEFGAFRSHYPDCAECADAVAGWTAFDLALRSSLDAENAAHPDPERLESYATSPETMGEEAMRIENHLTTCQSCQTEMNLLHAYDPDLLLAGAGGLDSHAAEFDRRADDSPLDGLRDFIRSLSGDLVVGWQTALPGLGVAVLTVLGLLFWWSGVESTGTQGTPTDVPRLAHEERSGPAAPEPSRAANPVFGIGDEPSDSQALEPSAHRQERIAIAPDDTTTDEEKMPIQLADAAPPEKNRSGASPPTVEIDENSVESSQSEEILLAALTSLPAPVYSAPPGAESLGWMRQFGAVRAGPTEITVDTRAPDDYAGLTLSSSPTLWWTVSRDTKLPIQITVVDEEAIEPLLRIELREPHSAGLYSIDLAKFGVKLEPEVDYRWFVSLLIDPNRPSRNPVAAGALRVIADSDSRREAAALTIPSERGHTLARLGLWYDAYDFFAALSVAHPEVEPIVRYRESLVALAKARH